VKRCEECSSLLRQEIEHEYWWDCPRAAETMNYGWHFARGQNDARREDFFKRAAADPFGV
jgi:hypothetical protein